MTQRAYNGALSNPPYQDPQLLQVSTDLLTSANYATLWEDMAFKTSTYLALNEKVWGFSPPTRSRQ